MNYFRGMALLTVSGVSKKAKDVFTVKDISFTQNPFQKIAIAGETGSGKTTLLKMIAGLEQPDAGEIWLEQKKVRGPADQLIPGNAGIAYLSQHFELRNNYWVHEILSYANELTQAAADTLYKVCRIDHLLSRRTDQLSGGERQRIALARLLIGSPRLLLLDEPFSNLDAWHKQLVKSVVHDISATLGISCIMVSHDAIDILSWADTILALQAGSIVQQGTPEQLYHEPVDEYCAGLFGGYNLLNVQDAALVNATVAVEPGEKRLLVRPEQFIVNAAAGGLPATVQRILFMGSYYQIEVTTSTQLLQVITGNAAFTIGQTVYLSVPAGLHQYIYK